MYGDQQAEFCELISKIGGTVIGCAAILIPIAIVVWPTTIDCQAVTGHTVCQER